MKSKLFLIMAVFVLVIGFESPAQAHDLSFSGPYGCGAAPWTECGYGGATDIHRWVFACDTRADGRGYYLAYELTYGGSGTVGDSNGSKDGCGGRLVTDLANPVARVKGCSASIPYHVCTGWYGA